MAKLVDALDLGSCGATRKSSNLFTCTKNKKDLLSGNFWHKISIRIIKR